MKTSYSKNFVNPYPNGWKDKPSEQTPITGAILEMYTKVFQALEDYLKTNGIPTDITDLTHDSNHLTVTELEKQTWNGKANRSDIPTKVSQLNNDERYASLVEELNDVNLDNLINGQTLVYNIRTDSWENKFVEGGGGSSEAIGVMFDNTKSGLKATNVQDAIDELISTILNGVS